uniref:1,3-beta-glucan synthase n=1 Tax=Leersia perrieri TaxID=77586 RepID=A0A0D9WKZ0_9ORYZ
MSASSSRRRPPRPERVMDNWERLVRAALKHQHRAPTAAASLGIGLASAVPPSLGKTNIEQILQAADDIEDEDPNVARILCEQAYTMAQNLDPSSDGRGVLQFKTGLASVIKQKLAKKDGAAIDRQNDIQVLWNFYQEYKSRRRVDDMQREQERLRESGTFSTEMGSRAVEMKKIYATLRALLDVLEILVGKSPSDRLGRQILDEIKRIKRSDAALGGELMPYNIVPLDAPSSVANSIGFFPEVRAATAAIQNCEDLPRFRYEGPQLRQKDIFDLLQYVFGFQEDNVRNQREHVVLALANAQSRLSLPGGTEPKIDERAVTEVFSKVLDNYIQWCRYLGKRVAWTSLEAVNKNRKIILVALYFLIWGEAANMAKELDGILDSSEAEPAKSCIIIHDDSSTSTSYLEKIITPIYQTMAAEAENNNNGKAAHSAWRNYDDFNEYFWSRSCFDLGWPPAEGSKFLRKPAKRKRTGKTNFVEHRTFLHLFRSCLDVILTFGAYKAARGFALSRLVIRKVLEEKNARNSDSTYFRIYVLVLGGYAAVRLFFALMAKIPACHRLSNFSDGSQFFQFFKWIYQIRPLVEPTNVIVTLRNLRKQKCFDPPESMGTSIYLMDIHIWYTLLSALVGGVMGARDRLGEIRSIEMLHKRFESFPEAFAKNLSPRRISNRPVAQIMLANDYAIDCKDSQYELWYRISRDEYMAYAVKECYYSTERILNSLVDGEGQRWVERLFRDLNESIAQGSLLVTINLKKLQLVQSRLTGLTGLLIRDETVDRAAGVTKALRELYEVVTHEFLAPNLREQFDTWQLLLRARNEGRLFSKIYWPKDPEMREQVKRLHLLLTVKDSAANIPKNLEAQRRLQFFTNSLFMDMPEAKPVSEMIPFSVFTPYYSETVLYSMSELCVENEDGISILFYLQKIYPDEWANFLERIGRGESSEEDFKDSPSDTLELRFWVSYRGQTLARTVRGMMYYRRALMLQSYLEKRYLGGIEDGYSTAEYVDTQGYELSPDARAQADLKFTYVVSCQIYGQQKQRKAPEAADIALLMQRNEALRVAFIHEEDVTSDGRTIKEYHSKLVKADVHGKDQEIYSIKLPGNPKLGEGKPENQNHAIIFTRGDAIQTIDMNQDNYLEEAMKMRNLLEEFRGKHGIRPPTILGVREHVFTGSVSSLASFMSNQETSFVTLGQRVLAYLKVRMHYGHPDVFDRIFHITRGGISKASRVINISEDIYAGFNSTLRQGNITHHEYIQVGKGRDVGLNQIALFEGKVAGGNGEQVLSRDVYRLGQLFDFFRMLTFFFTTVGYYVCTMMTVLTVYVFLYGRVYLALSGLDYEISRQFRFLGNTALDAALNAQFLVQIGIFTAVPMIMGFILELGLLKAIFSFITMQLQFCSVFFTFSLGTRTHYFGRTILHGGAKYHATGRGFVVRHIKFAENYRLYSRSHFVKALEVALLLIVYIAYGFTKGGASSFILITISSWFLVVSWLFAPYIFNPSGFEWQKTVEDFDDWTNWLLYKGGVGVKGENSWESWWDEEQAHIQTLRGRILETILSLRFLIFQYGIVYKLKITSHNTSLALFTATPKKSTALPTFIRFLQGLLAIGMIAGIALLIALTEFTIADLFASALAFVATGWCLAVTWKWLVKAVGLWDSVREIARMYDAGMGALIFVPIVFFSWFPFVSTFQSRFLFNQAFSRGLEISLILAGNKANQEA